MKRWNRTIGALAGLWLAGCTQVVGLDHRFVPAIDAQCQSTSDCSSGVCNGNPGWCTELCTSDTDCPSGWCIQNSNSVYSCFPGCSSSADCDTYGVPGLSCQPTTSIDGAGAGICTR